MITPKEKKEIILKSQIEALEKFQKKVEPFLKQNSAYFQNAMFEFFRLEIKQKNEELKKLWNNEKIF